MPSGLQTWSKTPGSNATADSSINWAEGQAPSSINDSARAMMARIAEWRDDLGGVTTGGSSTALTVTSNRQFASAAVMDKAIITFIPHTTSGAAPTLAVDGLTARSINYSTGVAVPTGALRSGTPYAVIYLHASTEFIVLGALATSPTSVPIGSMMDFAGTSAPGGWLLCFGQVVSRTTFAALFAVIGTAFGSGDGSTTFNLPDCRGRVVAGKDDMGGSSANRLTNQAGGLDGDVLAATGGGELHVLTQAQLPNVSPTFTGTQINLGTLNANQTFLRDTGTGTPGGAGGTADDAPGATPTVTIPPFTPAGTISALGSGVGHNNVQPTIICNKIIFAGV